MENKIIMRKERSLFLFACLLAHPFSKRKGCLIYNKKLSNREDLLPSFCAPVLIQMHRIWRFVETINKAIEKLLLVEHEAEASGIDNTRAMAQGHLEDGVYETV